MPGDTINEHFATKEIGDSETWKMEFKWKMMVIHCMKEEKYVAKFMTTFRTLDKVTSAGEPFSWHNKARH